MIFQSTDQPAAVLPGAKFLPQTRIYMRATWEAFKSSGNPGDLRINLNETLKAAEAATMARRPLWACWEELFTAAFVQRPEWPAFIAEHVAPTLQEIRKVQPALRLACWPAPWNKQRALEQEMPDAAAMSRRYFEAGIDRMFDAFTPRFYVDDPGIGEVQFRKLLDRFEIIHERFRLPMWPVISPWVYDGANSAAMLTESAWQMIVELCVARFEHVIVWEPRGRTLTPELARRYEVLNRLAAPAEQPAS